jgi:ketosteroid isomerase-like protein
MDRRTVLAGTAAAAAGLALRNNQAAAQQPDADKVKAALDAFYAALSALDMGKMDVVWAHDVDAMLVNPRDKSISVGWDAIKKNWETVFGGWSELKVARTGGTIHISGNVAWAMGTADVVGKSKDGAAVNFTALNADVLEKRGDNWLMVSHGGWRAPQ